MAKKQVGKKNVKDTIALILPTRYRLKCKNHIQKEFANLITEKEIVIAAGPAGVGKSYVAVARAIELLQNKSNKYNKIIITSSGEGVGKDRGFIPGTLREKMEPEMGPVISIFDKIIGKTKRLELEEAEILILAPLTYVRGASIDNTILLMEEAQNTSPFELKTLLTRIGENSKFIISGDLDQSDRYKYVNQTGLYDVLHKHRNIEEIGFIEFGIKDIVRNPLICKILGNYKVEIMMEPKKESKPKPPQEQNKKKKVKYSRFRAWIRKNFKW
jgi:phosphate starvation-inducible PhoH-like protein